MRKDLEESQTPFVLFLICFRGNHLLIATPYRPIFVVVRTSTIPFITTFSELYSV
ncbi:uncharacterized protein K441DRAFT_671857 [Cenococcum geophilum 1.58]|uniref:Uncharacterized protein n=1 Tax=Cenococcum geophilum 1.58 TaxID=794803 RepID=A0ACC8EKU3_9PEZI|nr:hypothetical protein K441DRAFT_671857 [Cenococcum geophilum 1.58]